jgi:hypothetical protein
LDDDDPFFLVKMLVVFFHMVAALLLTSIYPGFSTSNKAHKYYLEYGLWVDLGWILLDETNSDWKAKSKVLLDYELKHTKHGTGQMTYLLKESTEGIKRGEVDRAGPTGLGPLLHHLAWIFSSALHAPLLLCERVLHRVALPRCSCPLLHLHN